MADESFKYDAADLLLKVQPSERPALRFLAEVIREASMEAVKTLLAAQEKARAQDKLEAEVAAADEENRKLAEAAHARKKR